MLCCKVLPVLEASNFGLKSINEELNVSLELPYCICLEYVVVITSFSCASVHWTGVHIVLSSLLDVDD
jgi:hypothetical protein